MFYRVLEEKILDFTKSKLGLLLLGPRQTGKSTLIQKTLKQIPAKKKFVYNLNETQTYEQIIKQHSLIYNAAIAAIEKGDVVLFIDEVQRVPELLNDCQSLFDQYKEKIRIFLTGSSARKLRRSGVNLLPGRVIERHLHPLILDELNDSGKMTFDILEGNDAILSREKPESNLEELLTFGSLPGLFSLDQSIKREVLSTYASTYLQEEIRAEALTRNIGNFSKILELFALQSGKMINLNAMSNETGVAVSTIKNYLELLEDTLIAIRIPPFTKNARKRIVKSAKYLFFDLGVRNACAGLFLHPEVILKTESGTLFEHWVILEIYRKVSYLGASFPCKIYYWRTSTGVEVDLIIETHNELIPIEIKYSVIPNKHDIRHLNVFLNEYPNARRGYIVGRFDHVQKLSDKIYAIPWFCI